jgi:two-component system sensor histidine kinase and response regulator WspE
MDLFREEVRSHAATLSQGLLDLENDVTDTQKIEPLMRAAHSIKGAARIVNIDAAVQLAHVMEDAFVAAQEGRIRITSADIDLLLRGTDLLAQLGQVEEGEVAAWSADHAAETKDLKERYRQIAGGSRGRATPVTPPDGSRSPTASAAAPATTGPSKPGPSAPDVPSPAGRPPIQIPREPFVERDDDSMVGLFREEVRTAALALDDSLVRLESGPAKEVEVEALAQTARSITGAARIVHVEAVAQLGRALEEFFTAVRSGHLVTAEDRGLLAEAIAFLGRVIQVSEEDLSSWVEEHRDEVAGLCKQLQGRMHVEGQHAMPPQPLPGLPQESIPQEVAKISPPSVPAPAQTSPAPAEAPAAAAEAVVRVTAQSLNRLMGLAGESLVQARWLEPFATALLKLKKQQDQLTAVLDTLKQALTSDGQEDRAPTLVVEARRQSALCREVLGERIREFQDHAAQAEDLNSRLYREVIASRMRPFRDGSGGFPRLVRDMARRLDKPVRLEFVGQDTAVDRDILEQLEAPLTHLLRNAVDHGIEPVAQRKAAGKPETGLVRVEASHRAGTLVITISDDGNGIDLKRLRAKVIERGLTTAELAGAMTEVELLEFLFLPGFSTAGAVSEYSGRGVGLDVVQTTIRKVGGSVRISTQAGKGTRFQLQLPLTLSVLRAVLVDIAGAPYAFPHNRIDRLLRVPFSAIRSLEQRQFVAVDNENIGLVSAAQLLGLPEKGSVPLSPGAGDELPVVLLGDQTGKYGLIVEAFRGEQDLVVRPLDPRLGKVPNISAAAILDDGSPVLIADVEDLIRSMDRFIQGNTLRRSSSSNQTAGGSRKRVLVVEDSITVRELERQLLRNHGYEVSVAVDGKEGWNMVRTQAFDLVITDVDMPRMNGLEMVQAIRSETRLREVPVIIVSYKERDEDRLRGLEVGANYYLTKSSFHDNTFLQAVADLIGEA